MNFKLYNNIKIKLLVNIKNMQNELKQKLQLQTFYNNTILYAEEFFDKMRLKELINKWDNIVIYDVDKLNISMKDWKPVFQRLYSSKKKNVVWYPNYFFNDINPEFQIGRMSSYSKLNIKMNMLPTMFRDFITETISDKIDIVNCHPTIINFLCDKFNIYAPYYKLYVNEREKILKELQKYYNVTKNRAKRIIFKATDTCHIPNEQDHPFIVNLKNDALRIIKELKNIFPITWSKMIKHPKKKSYMGEWWIAKTIFETIENHLLMGIIWFFKENNAITNNKMILMYDGIIIPKNHSNKMITKQCEKFLFYYFKIPIKLSFN